MTGQSRMQLEQLHSKRQAIEALGLKFGAKRIRVFGSVARGEENDRSDIAFLVCFPRGYDLFTQRLPLTEELSLLLNRAVEVVPEHKLSRVHRTPRQAGNQGAACTSPRSFHASTPGARVPPVFRESTPTA